MSSRILVVEDAPSNAKVIVSALKESYSLSIATRGEEALRILDENPAIDLILLDLTLPDMNGFDVLERVRAIEATKATPVIILTGSTNEADKQRANEMEAAAYLTKPVGQEALREAVTLAINPT